MRRLGLLTLAMLAGGTALGVEVDGIAAKVGSDIVLKSDVVNEMKRLGLQDSSRYGEILDEMIERRLVLKAANDEKLTMEEWVVENRIREIINKAFGGDRNKLIEVLGQQRISYPEWRLRMKEDMVVGAMRWKIVNRNVTASPAEMRREYEEHPERYSTDEQVSVSVILLKPEEKDRRDEISAQLKEKDFAELGGRTFENVKPQDMFKKEICDEIVRMPKGTISHWIELDGWSFLIRKDSEIGGRKLPFDEAYDKIEENVKEAQAKEAYQRWIDRLKAETYIRVF